MSPPPLILAFGDSLVAGYGLAAADGFAPQLERRLRLCDPDIRVINAGVSGDTTADALHRLPRVLSRLDARPGLAIVQLGPNDVLRRVTPATTRANLERILLGFARCGVPALLTTVEAPAFLRAQAAAYAGIQQDAAARHGAGLVPFFPPGVLGRPDMVLADRVHPNAKAIAVVVEAMVPAILRALTAPSVAA